MFDYRLFYPQHSLQEATRDRRQIAGQMMRRVHALNERRSARRSEGRR